MTNILKFHSDLYTSLTAAHVFEPILKLRISKGLKISDFGYLGLLGGKKDEYDQLDMGGADVTQSWNFDIEYTETLPENSFVYVQTALLYTAINSKRYIRVHNLRLKTTKEINEIFTNCDIECIVNSMLKRSVKSVMEKNLYDGIIILF